MYSDLIAMMIGYGLGSTAFLVCRGTLEIFKSRKSLKLRGVILKRLEMEPSPSFGVI
jgi:hypothetical protein